MPKQVKIQSLQPDEGGPAFGLVSDPADAMKMQIFCHGHSEILAADFVVGKCNHRAVCGFDNALLGGLQFRVLAPGHVVTPRAEGGHSYEIIGSAPVDFILTSADETLPRVDLIVAKLETVDAADELRPFVRLLTQQELDNAVAPYPPVQYTTPTEIHLRAVVLLKTGEPSATPVAPDVASDEEPLYQVTLLPGSTWIDRVKDLRHLVASNCELQDRIEQLRTKPPVIPSRWPADVIDLQPDSPGFKRFGKTDQDCWDKLALELDIDPAPTAGGAALRPEILRPDVPPYNAASGKLGSGGVSAADAALIDGGGDVPLVKIPYPRQVAFSTGVFPIEPAAFVDQTLNPRLLNFDVDAPTKAVVHVTDFSLGVVEVVQTDGGGEWSDLHALSPISLSSATHGVALAAEDLVSGSPRAAAEDGRYTHLFGGAGLGNTSWERFDTVSKTYAARAFSGDVPVYPIVFALAVGGGKALIQTLNGAAPYSSPQRHWFLVDLATGVSTEKTVAPGGADDPAELEDVWAIGTLLQANVVFLVLTQSEAPYLRYAIYHVDTDEFEYFTPSGLGPTLPSVGSTDIQCCLYKEGEAVLLQIGYTGRTTWTFNYQTRGFSKLNLLTNPTSTAIAFQMANVNGRPQAIMQDLAGTPAVWELTPSINAPAWRQIQTGLPVRFNPLLTSMLSNGLPQGSGYLFGGYELPTAAATKDAYGFAAGGIVQSLCGDSPGITLGDGTKSATIRVSNFQLPASFQVARMAITLKGQDLQGRVKVVESFDDGEHWQEIPVNQNVVILSSNASPNRQLMITLTGTDNVKPCLSQSTETFEKTGGVGLGMLYLVYDCPPATTYLYMDNRGKITSEDAAVETTKGKAILHRVIKDGDNTPNVFDFLNKPWFGKKYEGGPKSGGVDPVFANDLAVLPSNIEAWKVAADGTVHLLADSTIVFNGDNTVTGLANGESYRVHLAG
jgi:hypothetical protein